MDDLLYGRPIGRPIFIWSKNFRIKKKSDVEEFMNMSKGEFHWDDGECDYWMEDGEVSSRPIFCRGNVFNPSVIERNPQEVIWNQRKYINRKLKGDY